jgi:antitoxin component YwqK of YwqJK toxin-antitoxin module
MRRIIFVTALLVICPFFSRAQFLSLPDLVKVVTAVDVQSAGDDLKGKNWSLMEEEEDEENGLQYETWSYGTGFSEYYDEYAEVAPGYINLVSREGSVTGLYYTVFEFELYSTVFNAMKDNGFRKERSKEFKNNEITVYTDGNLLMLFDTEVINEEENPESSYTAYMIYLVRKSDETSTVEDGEKKDFYETGELKAEYTIVGGKPHGAVRIYDIKGFMVQESYYSEGLLHGQRKFWFPSADQNTGIPLREAGQLYLVSNYSKGMQHGEEIWYYHAAYQEYPCEVTDSAGVVMSDTCRRLVITKDKEIINYRNDMLHGNYEKYNEAGELVSKGKYRKGVMTGKWFNKPEED